MLKAPGVEAALLNPEAVYRAPTTATADNAALQHFRTIVTKILKSSDMMVHVQYFEWAKSYQLYGLILKVGLLPNKL